LGGCAPRAFDVIGGGKKGRGLIVVHIKGGINTERRPLWVKKVDAIFKYVMLRFFTEKHVEIPESQLRNGNGNNDGKSLKGGVKVQTSGNCSICQRNLGIRPVYVQLHRSSRGGKDKKGEGGLWG